MGDIFKRISPEYNNVFSTCYCKMGDKVTHFKKHTLLPFDEKKAMKKAIRVFEPVTADQLKLLHSAPSWVAGSEVSRDRLYECVVALAGIPSMSSLSRQEAAFLIERLKGQPGRRYPAPARYENEVAGDASSLPSFYHVRDIRLMFRELAWDKAKIEGWLLKWRKVKNIRSLDRINAQGTYTALKNIVAREKGRDCGSNW